MNINPIQEKGEAHFQKLLEATPDAMIITNSQGKILMANALSGIMFGYSQEEFLGQPIELVVPKRFQSAHKKHRSAYFSNPAVRSMGMGIELTGLRKDGSEFPTEISLAPMKTDNGLLIISTIRDITERKQVKKQIETNLLVQSAVSSILKISLEPISLHEILERTLEELFSIPWIAFQSKGSIFLVKDDPNLLIMKAQRGLPQELLTLCGKLPVGKCLCGQAAARREIVFTNSLDGHQETHYPGMVSHGHYCVPIVSDHQLLGVINLYVEAGHKRKPEGDTFLLSVADVLAGTIKRKNAEEALRRSEERFALAVQGTDAGIWDWDLCTNEVYFSPRWKTMLGFEEHEIKSHFSEWENRLHLDDRERAFATLQNYLKGLCSEYELEHRLQHKDGSYRWILARGAVVRDDKGVPFRMVGSHIDITDRKRIEEALTQKEAQLLAAQSIQAKFLPKKTFTLPGFDIAGNTYPADLTGGDLFDYIPMPDGAIGFVIGDVTGHGIGPALVMSSTHAYLHSFTEIYAEIDKVLARTNSALMKETEPDMFVTTFFGRLDPKSRKFVYASAGHTAGYVLDGTGATKAQLARTSIPLAILPDTEFPMADPITLEKGDMILLLTDGVLEARSPEGIFFGMDRTLQVVRENQKRKAREIVDTLYQAICMFSKRKIPWDDVTMIVVKIEPREDEPNE